MKLQFIFILAIKALLLSPSQACVCPMNYEPVCGTNGVTYSNACSATCASVTVARAGECESTTTTAAETESTTAAAEAGATTEAASSSSAPAACACNRMLKPVCGTNGKTYSNKCLARCENVKVAHQGTCAAAASRDSTRKHTKALKPTRAPGETRRTRATKPPKSPKITKDPSATKPSKRTRDPSVSKSTRARRHTTTTPTA